MLLTYGMLNATLFALSAGSLAHSPFLTADGINFRSHLCTFSYLFSTAIYSTKEMKSLLTDNTIFRNIIGTGIILESKTYTKQVFEENVVENSPTVTVQSCLFINCIASIDNGGGIQITNSLSSVKISNTGFTNCRTSANGGAFYVISKEISIDQCCITSCTADEYDAFYFSNPDYKNEDELKSTYIYSITPGISSTSVIYFDSELPVISNNNFTSLRRNAIRSIFEIQSADTITFQYNSFISCLGKSILYFHYFKGQMRNCNFDDNQATNQLVYFEDKVKIEFDFCCFMNDNSKCYTNQYSWFVSCIFDHPIDEDKFPHKDYTSHCTFNSKYTTNDIEIPGMSKNGCWALITNVITELTSVVTPDADIPSSLSSTLYGVMIVALIIIVGILGFFIYRWCKARHQKDYMLTMYAQV